jgi:hypothetical protein
VDRHAIFVDAGYLLAEGGKLCCGTRRRRDVACDYPRLVEAVTGLVGERLAPLPLLRVYWYDGAPDGQLLAEHALVGLLPNVKLRLGRLSGGAQKGVDSLLIRDLMTLARERAVATAVLIGGDEDLREGVIEAQDLGVRVVILGIASEGAANQASTLIREADEHEILDDEFLRPFFALAGSEPASVPDDNVEEIVDRIGAERALAWRAAHTPVELAALIADAPRIPHDLDAGLLHAAEAAIGSALRGRDVLRRRLRAAFWDALRAAESRLGEPPGGESR